MILFCANKINKDKQRKWSVKPHFSMEVEEFFDEWEEDDWAEFIEEAEEDGEI